MSTNRGLGEFLRAMRANVRPDDIGLASHGARRVSGLRREELAHLAGVSVSYYTRIEQGQGQRASPAVLDALADALRLDPDQRAHLHHLAKPARGRARAARPERVAESTKTLVSTLGVPAAVAGRSMDILAWNPLCHALLAAHLDFEAPESPTTRPNWARLVFLDEHARDLFVDWDQKARDVVSYLRMAAGRYPFDRRLANLVAELSVASREFGRLWGTHIVGDKGARPVRFRHPLVGDFTLNNVTLRLTDVPDQMLATFHADPGSPADFALQHLGRSVHPSAAAVTVEASGHARRGRRRQAGVG